MNFLVKHIILLDIVIWVKRKEFKGEIKNKKKNGEAYWVDVTISCDYDKDKKHIGFTSIRKEITKQKALEEKLKEITLNKKEG
jgi:PAS domain S-box-containing protein